MRTPVMLCKILCATTLTAILAIAAAQPAFAQASLTARSHSIGAGVSAGNLEGAACPASSKMISGSCHPSYSDQMTIINQFPNVSGNTWRCGFKNNTAAAMTVWVYTVFRHRRSVPARDVASGGDAPPAADQYVVLGGERTDGDGVPWRDRAAMHEEANNAEFGRSDCCNSPPPSGLRHGGWPEFDKYGFIFVRTSNLLSTWDQLRREPSDAAGCSRRPFAFSWHWPGGGWPYDGRDRVQEPVGGVN